MRVCLRSNCWGQWRAMTSDREIALRLTAIVGEALLIGFGIQEGYPTTSRISRAVAESLTMSQ